MSTNEPGLAGTVHYLVYSWRVLSCTVLSEWCTSPVGFQLYRALLREGPKNAKMQNIWIISLYGSTK